MSLALRNAIDTLLEYVEEHHRTPDYGNPARMSQLLVRDMLVYVEARKAGLLDCDMPPKIATAENDQIRFFGRTNIPGFWLSPPDGPSTLHLMPEEWRIGMLTLRELAWVNPPPEPTADVPTVVQASDCPTSSPTSASELARLLNQPVASVESFLRRHRVAHPDCFFRTDAPRKNEPQYLYRPADVWAPLCQHYRNGKS